MNPGPELDALVAEKVMGWELTSENIWMDGKEIVYLPCNGYGSGSIIASWSSFNPSSCMISAWAVVEKIGEEYEIHVQKNWDRPSWRCYISSHDKEPTGRVADISMHTAQYAICLAAITWAEFRDDK